jgi:hypothetical protein
LQQKTALSRSQHSPNGISTIRFNENGDSRWVFTKGVNVLRDPLKRCDDIVKTVVSVVDPIIKDKEAQVS